jgi:hypothetical protein
MGVAGTEAPTMAYSEDIFLPDNRCEICGAELSNEIVIQEFADGSIARLCAECAAGAALQAEGDEFRFPEAEGAESGDDSSSFETSRSLDTSASFDDSESFEVVGAQTAMPAAPHASSDDPMEKTRELLTPVVDLITLQSEMQGALQRLATSLETFATGVLTEKADKRATVEERLESLERELEQTRTRLRDTEALLAASGVVAAAGAQPVAAPPAAAAVAAAAVAAAAPDIAATTSAEADTTGAFQTAAGVAAGAALVGAAGDWEVDSTMESSMESILSQTAESEQPEELGEEETSGLSAGAAAVAAGAFAAGTTEPGDAGTEPYVASELLDQSTLPPAAPPVAPLPVAPPAGPPTAEHHNRPGFQLAEVQLAQKYFNDSQFTGRIRDVRKSLGKPKANLTKLIGDEPRALLTIAWDIIWYQYLIDLRREIPTDQRVILHREGMDLDELTALFREKNSSVDDEGRLDASELEVKLLSDPSTLITEMSDDEERALEDATEEIWDQKTAPEFKWDD